MPTDDDGKKYASVTDIKTRLPVEYTSDDPVVRMAEALTIELCNQPGELAERLAALGVVSRALVTIARKAGATEAQVDAITTKAVKLAQRCEVVMKPKDG